MHCGGFEVRFLWSSPEIRGGRTLLLFWGIYISMSIISYGFLLEEGSAVT